ncbi:uncharacterized protein BCR38DRAFT_422642 [Pseudomassariella vexata]|uniref:Uncharacterized protein n=1 Tax=Pseudomassariella vexata TaxID=1141098 RepID=A0A1Y2E9N3_9PEZI|nr:uncharacterized protein BCR38DRAFT_422642 [Pseudomassariella vexata]ORY68281.1 hypothetical protein BCR38DRAFT_422642 [Pseudomassariella vexata]
MGAQSSQLVKPDTGTDDHLSGQSQDPATAYSDYDENPSPFKDSPSSSPAADPASSLFRRDPYSLQTAQQAHPDAPPDFSSFFSSQGPTLAGRDQVAEQLPGSPSLVTEFDVSSSSPHRAGDLPAYSTSITKPDISTLLFSSAKQDREPISQEIVSGSALLPRFEVSSSRSAHCPFTP